MSSQQRQTVKSTRSISHAKTGGDTGSSEDPLPAKKSKIVVKKKVKEQGTSKVDDSVEDSGEAPTMQAEPTNIESAPLLSSPLQSTPDESESATRSDTDQTAVTSSPSARKPAVAKKKVQAKKKPVGSRNETEADKGDGKAWPARCSEDESGGGLEERFSLSWSDLKFSVPKKSQPDKIILNGLNGLIEPGEMVALMGPSGGGKTTLLDLLGNRVSSGRIEGNILIGKSKADLAISRKLISYVSQEDSLLSCFTVRETLRYAARLSLASFSASKREERIEAGLTQMGLLKCADARVGDPLIKGISGGQKRRLSIAIEVLKASPLLLLDEPTSGLDSESALHVMEHIRHLADKGHTVAFSIHQPSSAIYDTFNSVCFLSAGRTLYFGPAGDSPIDHFANLGHKCPQFTSPTEFVLSLANVDFQSPEGDVKTQINSTNALVEAFPNSSAGARLKTALQKVDSADALSYSGSDSGAVHYEQFFVLFVRILHMSYKSPYIFAVRLVMYTALSFMVGTMYLGVGETARGPATQATANAAYSLLPLLYYVQAFLVFMSVAVLPFFLEQRDVFRRERGNGQIECMPFVLANFFANLPGIILIALMSSILVVPLADLNGFGGFFLNLLLALIAAESLMHVIGAAQPHYIIGMAFGAGMFGMFMLCEGFMVPYSQIPAGWKWGHYLALHTYSFAWFMHNQFSGPDGGAFGQKILEDYDVEDVDATKNAFIILLNAVLFEVGFFFVLKIVHTGRR